MQEGVAPIDLTYKGPRGWRTRCCVPGCNHTKLGRWSWWCCADHWRPVSRQLKTLRTKMKRRFRRRGEITVDGLGWYCTTDRSRRAMGGIDRRLIRDAVEKGAGL